MLAAMAIMALLIVVTKINYGGDARVLIRSICLRECSVGGEVQSYTSPVEVGMQQATMSEVESET